VKGSGVSALVRQNSSTFSVENAASRCGNAGLARAFSERDPQSKWAAFRAEGGFADPEETAMKTKFLTFFAAAVMTISPLTISSTDARMGGGFGGGHIGSFGGHVGGFGGGHFGGMAGPFGGFGGRPLGMAPGMGGVGITAFHGAQFNRPMNFRGARFNHVRFDRHRNRFIAAPFLALPYLASYDSGYYSDCLVRVWTPWGWRLRNACDYYGYGY
jgi:hypothetical protein